MDNGVCTLTVNNSTCFNCCSSFFKDPLQDLLDAPMPWIGIYIAVASAICFCIVLYDALYNFGTKRFWFPSKYFSLNSFTLTLLAVAMKLPLDLTDKMIGPGDKLARVTSLVFLSIAMANFITCLGSMGNHEILLNMASLSILVITIAVNVSIRNVQMSSFKVDDGEPILWVEIVCTVVMILLLLILCSLSIMVPNIKKHIESEYQYVHSRSISESKVEWGNFNIDELRKVVRRYWVMAQTGSPQFVIARSVICVLPSSTCLMGVLLVIRVGYQLPSMSRFVDNGSTSCYKKSTMVILAVQSLFVAIATIAPAFRLFTAAQMKVRQMGHRSTWMHAKFFTYEFTVVDMYWTQMPADWKTSPLPSIIKRLIGQKLAISARKLLLNLCFGFQVAIVLLSKIFLLLPAIFVNLCLFRRSYFSEESRDSSEEDISCYVVLLEREGELSNKTLRNLCKEVDKLIKSGQKRQPQNLIKLLQKSVNFNGVREFDSKHTRSLHPHEDPYYSWSLPIVTLASIAIALPNITTDNIDQLLGDVSRGLYYVKLVEDAMDRDASKSRDFETFIDSALHRQGQLASISNAVYVIWAGVELERKWHDVDIQRLRHDCKSYKNVLQKLSCKTEKIMDGFIREDPKNWSAKVISANAMYRITRTIMKASGANHSQTEVQLFERLSIMISDILCACLTNLARVITLKCHINDIEERDENVRQVALLLGESEEILEMLQQRELPRLDARYAGYIEHWRTFMEQDI